MGLKSVLDIDVKDERFKAFQEHFDKYQQALARMPGAWAGVDKRMRSSFETVAAAMLAQNELIKKAAQQEKNLANQSDHVSKTWKEIAKSTKSALGDIAGITTSILKWTGIGSIVSGLAGLGGLFGLERLAASAGAARRSSLGLGTTPGSLRAFQLNFQRLVEPDAFLSGINEALHDVTKRSSLYRIGLNESDLRGKDTAQVAALAIDRIKRLADRTPQALLGQVLSTYGLDQFGVSLEGFERTKNTPGKEISGYLGNYARDQKQFEIDAKAWQDLDVQLERAGRSIDIAFIRGLDPLIRNHAFENLSKGVVEAINTLMSSKEMQHFLTYEIGPDLNNFAKYLRDPKTQQDFKDLAHNVGAVAEGLAKALRWLGLIPDFAKEKKLKAAGVEEGSTGFPFIHTYTSKNGKQLTSQQWAILNGVAAPVTPPHLSAPAIAKWHQRLTEANVQAMLKAAFPGIRITEGRSHSGVHVGNSMHRTGEAVDFVLPKGISFAQMREYLKKIGFPMTELLHENYRGVRHGVPSTGPHEHLGWRQKGAPHNPVVQVEVRDNTGGNVVIASNQIAR